MLRIRLAPILAAFSLLSIICLAPAWAQDVPAEPAPAPPPAVEAPPAVVEPAPAVPAPAPAVVPAVDVTPDVEVFKRTPVIDGTVEEGEWDAFYTFSAAGWDATACADWDPRNLYFAAKSNRPGNVMVMLDANGDGWLNGEDNYQLVFTRDAAGAVSYSLNRYDSHTATAATAPPVTAAELAMVTVRSADSDGSYMVEAAIPAAMIRTFRPAPGTKIGLMISVQQADGQTVWTPPAGAGDLKQCTLTTKKTASLKPLVVDFELLDTTIARGDELRAKFHMTNTGADTVDAQSFVIAGEGKSGDYLSSQKVRIEGLPPKKHIAHEFRSIIPSDMPLGSWAIGTEARSKAGRLGGVLMSFDVVEPVEIELRIPEKPVPADVKDVTYTVIVNNNLRRDISGTVRITLPAGWDLWKNADTRQFAARARSSTYASFKAKPPLGVPTEVPVKVEVAVEGQTWATERTMTMFNP